MGLSGLIPELPSRLSEMHEYSLVSEAGMLPIETKSASDADDANVLCHVTAPDSFLHCHSLYNLWIQSNRFIGIVDLLVNFCYWRSTVN